MPITNKKQWKKLLAKAHKGDSEAQWEVGSYYDDGLELQSGKVIVKPRPKKAFKWFSSSASQGNESAQLALGNILSTGIGTKRDFPKAIYWTKKAIEQGSASGTHNLGTIYRDLQKPKLSFKWYTESVKMGNYDSLLQIGLCHLFGYGTIQNYVSAQRAFEKIFSNEAPDTCERTKEDAQYWLSIINLLELNNKKSSLKKARKLLEDGSYG
jgi:hypothetical protein